MTNAELIECLRCENENYGDCSLHESDCKYRFGLYCAYRQKMHDAADALEAADKRIAELERILKAVQENSGINFRLWQEAEARMQTVTDCHTLEEGER